MGQVPCTVGAVGDGVFNEVLVKADSNEGWLELATPN